MGGFVLLEEGFGLCGAPGGTKSRGSAGRGTKRSTVGGVTQTHVRSASLEDTKSHSSSGRPSPSATTFWMALPTKPVPPVTRMRLDFSPAASVMATALCYGGRRRGKGGELRQGHLRGSHLGPPRWPRPWHRHRCSRASRWASFFCLRAAAASETRKENESGVPGGDAPGGGRNSSAAVAN